MTSSWRISLEWPWVSDGGVAERNSKDREDGSPDRERQQRSSGATLMGQLLLCCFFLSILKICDDVKQDLFLYCGKVPFLWLPKILIVLSLADNATRF